jgi:hypothetical protein
MDKRLLINRKFNTADYDIKDNWYAGKNILEQVKSVKQVTLDDTTSSAGDWSGMLVQELNKICNIIPWNQVNNWPRAGYTVYTGEVFCRLQSPLLKGELDQIITDYYNQ